VKVIVDVTCRRSAFARVNVTSYRMSVIGAEVAVPWANARGGTSGAESPASSRMTLVLIF